MLIISGHPVHEWFITVYSFHGKFFREDVWSGQPLLVEMRVSDPVWDWPDPDLTFYTLNVITLLKYKKNYGYKYFRNFGTGYEQFKNPDPKFRIEIRISVICTLDNIATAIYSNNLSTTLFMIKRRCILEYICTVNVMWKLLFIFIYKWPRSAIKYLTKQLVFISWTHLTA